MCEYDLINYVRKEALGLLIKINDDFGLIGGNNKNLKKSYILNQKNLTNFELITSKFVLNIFGIKIFCVPV